MDSDGNISSIWWGIGFLFTWFTISVGIYLLWEVKISRNSEIKLSGVHDEKTPITRWLLRLAYDFKRAGLKKSGASLLGMQAIDGHMTERKSRSICWFYSKISKRSVTRPKWRSSGTRDLINWRFPPIHTKIPVIPVQAQLQKPRQGYSKALMDYYQRTLSIFHEIVGRNTDFDKLSKIEQFSLPSRVD